MDVLKWHRGYFGWNFFMVLVMLVLTLNQGYAGTATAQITMTLPEQVNVDTADVTLGQLAIISGADDALNRQMDNIIVGRAPLPGNSRTISRDYIALRLRQSGIDPDAIRMNVPEKVTIVRRAVTISAADIEMLVREYLAANPPFDGADMTITNVRVPGDIMLPTGNVQQEVQLLLQSRPSGTLPVNIFFSMDGILVKRVMATVNVVLMKDIPVTKHPIARYQLIEADDLMMQTLDMSDLPANTVLSYDEIKGQRARRAIGPQSVLRSDQFEFPPP